MDDFLVFDEVSKHFGALKAVNGVTLRIKQGEVFSLLGPSGCGKTTLLRLAAGFERPDGGRVLLGGQDITALPPNRRPVNTVFQNYALFPHLTVAENIGFGPRAAGRPKKEIAQDVARMMQLVQLHEHAHKRPGQLSGGQKQRVAIARALINKPRVLLLDEPLAALDLKLRQRMLLELAAIHREVGATFIYVTHDQTEAMSLSDRIAVMNAGKVEQIGAPEDLYDRPASEFVASFIGDTNMLVGSVSSCEAGRIQVTLGDGLSLSAVSDAAWANGSEVRMSVRPEHLQVSRLAFEDRPSWRVQLEEAIYLGASVRCWLSAGSIKLCADLPASGGDKGPRGWKMGETFWVTVDPADVNVVNRPVELMV